MGFWSEVWDTAKSLGKGVVDVFVGVISVLVLTIWAIGYVIFSIFDHLYDWIDNTIEWVKDKFKIGSTTMVPPEETEKFIAGLNNSGKTTLPPYKPGTKRTLMVAHDTNGKVVRAQVASTTKGFEEQIQAAFDRGDLIEQPVS